MRNFVIELSNYAKGIKPEFNVIPQNGHELLVKSIETFTPATDYISHIDGVGREELYYGYNNIDDKKTPQDITDEIIKYMDFAKSNSLTVLVTNYCSDSINSYTALQKCSEKGYLCFNAYSRELDTFPVFPKTPYEKNKNDINFLSQAKNFLYWINPSTFSNKNDFIETLNTKDYDIIILDLFFVNEESLTHEDLKRIKIKSNGGRRLLIAYMSIGEAENYRYYWKKEWDENPPEWLCGENPDWEGNYKVKYWLKEWKNIIMGNDSSYLKRIIDAGFDGVYLDIIDAYEYFEEKE